MSHHYCESITRIGNQCVRRSRYTLDLKHYCGTHANKISRSSNLQLPKEDTSECVVCYDSICNHNSKITLCNHVFCTRCLNKWIRRNNTCPLCRTSLKPPPEKPPDFDVYVLIRYMIANYSLENYGLENTDILLQGQ